MLIRQLFDASTSSYTYLIADEATREAVLVDPVLERVERDARLLGELGLRLKATIETHVHADHVTGAAALRAMLGSQIITPDGSGTVGGDRYARSGEAIEVGNRHLIVRSTPGHTAACLTFVLDDRSAAFTGDCLLVRGTGRTDLQGGDAARMFRSIIDEILTLPDDCRLYPAHDYDGQTVTTVREERLFNKRVRSDGDEVAFAALMGSLHFAPPRNIDAAVPANLRCGRLLPTAA